MAGLCRSIIENVFTKVIRVSNLDSLGDKIVVQGGTFQNDAVLRAMEQYLGKNVVRAPYPGIMGAIGAALITKERFRQKEQKTFIGLEAMDDFSYTQESNAPCPFCANHCKRTIIRFSNGNSWITNNRCERGEVLGDPKDKEVQAKIREKRQALKEVPNLYILREELLMKNILIRNPKFTETLLLVFRESSLSGRLCHFGEPSGRLWDLKSRFLLQVQERCTRKDCLPLLRTRYASRQNLFMGISAVWQKAKWTGSLCHPLQR